MHWFVPESFGELTNGVLGQVLFNRGFPGLAPAVWQRIMEQGREVEGHGRRLPAELGRQRRLEKELPEGP